MENTRISQEKKKNYKEIISFGLAGFFLFLANVYLELSVNDVEVLHFLFIPNEEHRIVVRVLFETILFGAGYGVIYKGLILLSKLWWKFCRKSSYLKGEWLHIHDKENLRIGVVSIEQEFYKLEVYGKNVKVNSKRANQDMTEWKYIGSEFQPDGSIGAEIAGCYIAKREHETPKYGVHILHRTDGAGGYPIRLEGIFGDIFRIEHKDKVDVADKTGRLYLFKMSEEIKKYIKWSKGNFDATKLSNISSVPEFAETDFVKTLKRIERKNELRREYKELFRIIDDGTMQQYYDTKKKVEKVLLEILYYAISADREIETHEVEVLTDIIGVEWKYEDIMAFSVEESNKSGLKEKLRASVEEIGRLNAGIDERFKRIVDKAFRYIIESDEIVTLAEDGCYEGLVNDILGK